MNNCIGTRFTLCESSGNFIYHKKLNIRLIYRPFKFMMSDLHAPPYIYIILACHYRSLRFLIYFDLDVCAGLKSKTSKFCCQRFRLNTSSSAALHTDVKWKYLLWFNVATQMHLAAVPQLWEPLLNKHKGSQTAGKSEKACCQSGSLSLLFLFLLPWYPWRSHEQRACFRWTAVSSLLPLHIIMGLSAA